MAFEQKVPPTTGAFSKRRKRRPSLKHMQLEQLPEATLFSDDADLRDPVTLVEALKAFPDLLRDLYDLLGYQERDGVMIPLWLKQRRPRERGNHVLLYLAFVLSDFTAMLKFLHEEKSGALWEACGYGELPDYQTLRLRFIELEERSAAFRVAAESLIRRAKRNEKRIGLYAMGDASEWHTWAVPEHCCPDPATCQALIDKEEKTKGKGKSAHRWRPNKRLRRASNDMIEATRSAESDAADPADGEVAASVATRIGEDDTYAYYNVEGHIYRAKDKTAGLRKYERGRTIRSWFGGYVMALIDVLTGAPLSLEFFAADEAEHHHWEDLLEGAVRGTGEEPLAVTVDRGNAVNDLHEHNTRRGIATVSLNRKVRGKETLEEFRCDLYDEHGIPRCRHCGGEGDQDSDGLGLYFDENGEPRIRFRCLTPHTEECLKLQSIACSENWLMLLPLSRKTELYWALRHMERHFERFFNHMRTRYHLAGKTTAAMLERRGVPTQRLRGYAALFLEWFRICLRHGWIGSWAKINGSDPVAITSKGLKKLQKMLRERRKACLQLPYGKAAVRLGIAPNERAGPFNILLVLGQDGQASSDQ